MNAKVCNLWAMKEYAKVCNCKQYLKELIKKWVCDSKVMIPKDVWI